MINHTARYLEITERASDRYFGLALSLVFFVITLLSLLSTNELQLWAIALGLIFGTAALTTPHILGPLNRIWTDLGFLLHLFVSQVVLGILYFGVVTPTGLLIRLAGKDSLGLRLQKDATTYWIPRSPPGPKAESLNNQF